MVTALFLLPVAKQSLQSIKKKRREKSANNKVDRLFVKGEKETREKRKVVYFFFFG